MDVRTLLLSQIKPYWRNPRENEKAVEAVIKSIQTYGYVAPIIVDNKHVIIAGHTRYKALVRLGYEKVECIVVDMPYEKAQAYRLVDNRTGELSTWDKDKLIMELRDMMTVPDFKVFFPEMDMLLQANVPNITDQTIARAEQDLLTSAKRVADEYGDNMVGVTCPHCGTDFSVYLKDIVTPVNQVKRSNGKAKKEKAKS